jgi:2,3-dihydroxy-2,3-dihydrophenylpropionate dehydrogenase
VTGWLDGNVALITGAGSGIGRAVALRYVAEGASVALAGRDKSRLEAVAAESGAPDRVLPIAADVKSSADMHEAVARTVERFGRLDTLVTNAGIWDYRRSLTRLSGQELSDGFDELFAVNVKGYLLAAEAAWRELVKTRGCIVMTLSNASFYVDGGGPLYTASKHACLGLMRQLAYELAPKVRVNGVACGGMRTDLRGPASLSLRDRSLADSFARHAGGGERPPIPLYESSVEPEDFTGPYVLLASQANSGTVTGVAIPVDGGIGVRGFRQPAGGEGL